MPKKPAEKTAIRGVNIEPIERATKRAWAEWLAFMDAIDADRLDHAQIAQRVLAELVGLEPSVDNPNWWAQGITVAYEQHSGRRLPGQQADGSFATSVSKTTNLSIEEAMARWVQFAAHDGELSRLVASQPRTSGSDKRKSWRANASDGAALLLSTEARPNGKTAIIIQLTKLSSSEAAAAAKERWAAVLARLFETL